MGEGASLCVFFSSISTTKSIYKISHGLTTPLEALRDRASAVAGWRLHVLLLITSQKRQKAFGKQRDGQPSREAVFPQAMYITTICL